ncbi:4'-phosphopantetheinyl transferase family protein [Sodalis ligni]|uniref:Enterobactin synthase component D n=1 Tax=Sodalis ligni TaxID=2697027 RepID=A0A4R1NM92_9GAMM|nr:4'-phosphopantetheinyl transferase superfamily protein [Sodalis ligni]TCL07121.1 4'-phosphopantetheinyl transferase EntD [Sodalis ligni]
MVLPAPYILSLAEGLPFGPADLVDPALHLSIWHCRFDTLSYRDADYGLHDIPLPPSIAGAARKRRSEYLAGRIVAARVLRGLGAGSFPLLAGTDRAPCWPESIQGSLSHDETLAVCIGRLLPQQGWAGVGIDVETMIADARTPTLWPGIIAAGERELLDSASLPFTVGLTLAFSAKESLFKALYPHVKRYFDFLDARVIQLTDRRISLELTTELAPHLPAGMRFDCAYALSPQEVLTLLTVG